MTVSLAGMVAGLLYSIQRDRSLPRLQLAYYPGIEQLVDAGEYRQALDQFNIAIHLDFLRRVRIYREIAQIALHNGDVDDHIRAWDSLIKLRAVDALTQVNLSSFALRRGEPGGYRQTEELSRELLRELPYQPGVNCNLGFVLLAQDRLDAAEQFFVQALQMNPYFGP
ncbi:MAG: tetratricopeptide repeat protein, partial [Planctomycetaceae bacterium]